jgi:hypothetical protein
LDETDPSLLRPKRSWLDIQSLCTAALASDVSPANAAASCSINRNFYKILVG